MLANIKIQCSVMDILIYTLQDFNSCGPNKETCVANQTIEHNRCLVPCTGLYADTYDDSLKENTQAFAHTFEQKVIKGTVNLTRLTYNCAHLRLNNKKNKNKFFQKWFEKTKNGSNLFLSRIQVQFADPSGTMCSCFSCCSI